MFSELEKSAASSHNRFPAKRISCRLADYLAKGAQGEPVILLSAADFQPQRVPLHLKHIRVDYGVDCRVQEGAGTPVDGSFVAVACSPENPQLFELFVRSAEALTQALPATPSASDIEACVRAFVELYRKLSEPSRRSIKGLWAELMLIASSNNPAAWLRLWHAESTEQFDFSVRNTHLEVKASELSRRVHEFSLEQIEPTEHSAIYVASMLLQRSSSGVGILDLADKVVSQPETTATLAAKLWNTVAQVVGDDFSEATDLKFNEQFALASLRFVPALAVPRIARPIPPSIFDIRFKADMTTVVEHSAVDRQIIETFFGKN